MVRLSREVFPQVLDGGMVSAGTALQWAIAIERTKDRLEDVLHSILLGGSSELRREVDQRQYLARLHVMCPR